MHPPDQPTDGLGLVALSTSKPFQAGPVSVLSSILPICSSTEQTHIHEPVGLGHLPRCHLQVLYCTATPDVIDELAGLRR